MGYAYPIDSKVVTNPNGTIDYDRASSSSQLRGLIKSMITNGVNLTESTNLQVMADEETMNLVVKPGYVIIEGALKHFEDDVKVTIGAADTTNPRIDTVVARLNLNEDVRDIVAYEFNKTCDNEKFYDDCVVTMIEYGLKHKQEQLLKQIKECRDVNERKVLTAELNKIIMKSKNKER